MKAFELYVILDGELLLGKDLIKTAEELLEKGVRIIQYRDKISDYDTIKKNCLCLRKLNIPVFIVNDFPELALKSGASGVHLGQTDMQIEGARKILGENKIIGKSTHNLYQALKAQDEKADYIGIGPVFATSTKKNTSPVGVDLVREVIDNVSIPIAAIGGINGNNIDEVLNTGVNIIAMVSCILRGEFQWDRYKKPEKEILLKK